jgi:hypothetical protein
MFARGVTNQQLMSFCLDSIEFDQIHSKLIVSFESLVQKVTARRSLEAAFKEIGGRYLLVSD